MLETIINKNVKLAEAASHGKSIFEYDKGSPGYFDFMKLAKELFDIYERRTKREAEGAGTRAG